VASIVALRQSPIATNVSDREARPRPDASGIDVLPAYEWLLAAPEED
jgi:hypothetical protein